MKTNQELLDEANKIDFKFTKTGNISSTHSKYERGLYFIKKAVEVHGIDTYQYGSVEYVDNSTKVEIICPEHGPFFQKPNNHKDLKQDCPKCANKYNPTTEEWVEKAQKVHGNKYDYSSTNYKCSTQKVVIICPEHGPFSQEAGSHLQGKGCAKCSNRHQHSTEEWIKLAQEAHGNRYDYSNVIYTYNKSKVEIVCPEHGPFWQSPKGHVHNFHGCPKCAGHLHDILYLFKCLETGWYKIGITTRNTQNRIRQIGGNIEEVFHVVCNNPREHENYLHKLYDKDREYNLCVKCGNTEFFSLNENQVKQVIDYMSSIAISTENSN